MGSTAVVQAGAAKLRQVHRYGDQAGVAVLPCVPPPVCIWSGWYRPVYCHPRVLGVVGRLRVKSEVVVGRPRDGHCRVACAQESDVGAKSEEGEGEE